MENEIWYDVNNGTAFPMTFEELLDIVRDNPESTEPLDAVFFVSSLGNKMSIEDILKML